MQTLQELNFSPGDMTLALEEDLLNRGIGNDTAASSGALYHARLLPLKAAVSDVRDKVLADLTPSDYDGVASQQMTWTTATLDETGEPYVLAARLAFAPTGDATIGAQTITGFAIVGSDSVTLLGAINLDVAVEVKFTGPVSLAIDTTVALKPPVNPG